MRDLGLVAAGIVASGLVWTVKSRFRHGYGALAAAAVSTALLAAYSVAVASRLALPIGIGLPALSGSTPALGRAAALIWWVMATQVATLLARLAIAAFAPLREAQILSDIAGVTLRVAAALAVTAFVFDLPIRGLLATSGVVAIVVGLALQNTLGDLFSGIAVGVERPYRLGDTVTIDGISGKLVEINWRSIHIRTGHDIWIVPNSMVAKGRVLNRSAPLAVTSDETELRLDAAHAPDEALPVIQAALRAVVSSAPGFPPSVQCVELRGDGIRFSIHYTAASGDELGALRSEILSRVHRHLRYAGLRLADPGRAGIGEPLSAPVPADAVRLLGSSDLFDSLGPTHRMLIAARSSFEDFDEGALLFAEGEPARALFVVAAGCVELVKGDLDAPEASYRMSPGESFGAVSLILGAEQDVSARAATAVRALRLDRDGLDAALREAPELAAELEVTVERGLRKIMRAKQRYVDSLRTLPATQTGRLRAFLHRLALQRAHLPAEAAPGRDPASKPSPDP